MSRVLLPDADAIDGGFISETGGTSLFPSLADPSTANFARSPLTPDGDAVRVHITAPTGAIAQPVAVRYTLKNERSDVQTMHATARLFQGANLIAEWEHTGLQPQFDVFESVLTNGQFAAITDFSDLFLEFAFIVAAPPTTIVATIIEDADQLTAHGVLSLVIVASITEALDSVNALGSLAIYGVAGIIEAVDELDATANYIEPSPLPVLATLVRTEAVDVLTASAQWGEVSPLPFNTTKRRVYDTIEMIGVNIELNVSGGSTIRPKIVEGCAYLGINKLRCNVDASPNNPGATEILVDAGLRVGSTQLTRANNYAGLKAELMKVENFVIARPGSVEGVEGPNEIGNFGGPFAYTDRFGTLWPVDGTNNAPIAFQNDHYFAMKTDASFPHLRNIECRHFTGPPTIVEGDCESVNFHPYPRPGTAGSAGLPKWVYDLYKQRDDMNPYPTPPYVLPTVFTETGYSASPTFSPSWYVDEATASILTITSLYVCVELKIHRIFIYELLDAGGGSQSREGLFSSGTPFWVRKPAADAVHNFITIINDTGATKATFTLTNLNYELAGLPTTAKHTLIQKSNGDHYILIWNHSDPIWAYPAGTPITPSTSHILTLNVPAGKSVQWFSPCESVSAGAGAAATRTLRKFPLMARVS